jgi:hypothetical protein
MIPGAPVNFWEKVVERVAQLIFERETALSAGVRLQGTGLVTNAERAAMALRVPGTMPSPAPPEAAK